MNHAPNKPKLCYIAPHYSQNEATHFAHLFDFIEEISKVFDVFLIIEQGEMPKTNFGCTKVIVIPSFFPLLNIGMLKLRIFQARILGYKDFYVHYSFKSAWTASLITRIFGGRVFYWNCGEPWKYTRGLLREWFERMAYRMITRLVTGTEGLKKKYAEVYGIPEKKITVMPNWISLSRFYSDGDGQSLRLRLGIPADARVVFFAHRLSKRKGTDAVVDIAQKFRDENIIAMVVGEGPEKENLELRTKNVELGNKIKFVGAVPNHQMPLYYSMADVFIMPSDEDGFPRVILEAMAMGVPFVAYDVGGIKEFVPSELLGFIVPHGDRDGFVRVVRDVLTMPPQKRSEIEAIEKNAVRQFETKEVAQRFYTMIVSKNS